MPLRSGDGTLLNGGGVDAPGMYGVLGFGTVAPGGGTTTGAAPGPVLIGPPKGGGVTGPPPATPGPVGIGLQTPPKEPAAEAGGLAGQKWSRKSAQGDVLHPTNSVAGSSQAVRFMGILKLLVRHRHGKLEDLTDIRVLHHEWEAKVQRNWRGAEHRHVNA